MREAYTLLRQSIIHVEHDAVDFDEEELEGERGNARSEAAADADAEGGDVQMADTTMDESVPVRVNVAGRQPAQPAVPSSSRAGSMAPAADAVPAAPAAAPKRRMVITHDKYIELQSMIILYLSAREDATGNATDREELIDWYLEQKEDEMQDVEQLEYEKELITKLLRKLVKVNMPLNSAGCRC